VAGGVEWLAVHWAWLWWRAARFGTWFRREPRFRLALQVQATVTATHFRAFAQRAAFDPSQETWMVATRRWWDPVVDRDPSIPSFRWFVTSASAVTVR
jgi:hypothetical protein